MKRYWSDYTSEAFSRLERDKILAILPVGAIEQHGPHLPVAVDAAIVDGMVKETIARLPDESHALFLPTQAIGKSNEHSRYPGSLTFSAETIIRMWYEIGACVAASGVRKMVLLNSHGGQISIMDIVARELRIRHNMMVVSVNWFALGMPEGVYSEHDLKHGIHAGDMETSVMLELHPDLVDMSKAQNFHTLTEVFESDFKHLSLSGGAKPAWQMQDINPSGAAGNATLATAEKGRKTIDFAAERLVEVLAEIERAPLSWLDNQPAW
ncbi:creatininase family protein [Brucella thiophenivorans]|uniref:Creatinine amidohydrolase family protein n=1 Tax=Brucella thiophenivorans TaxID=571255 RepID=A0A256FIQ3_9HYPH|nr:creatininase family protein [Brucella thiophenivorans]OYR14735.1 creatinine amidohydrolase family protein [Brucella thiophenivorans]